MTSYAVVTTFHDAGYKKYGKKMVETFVQYWPKTVTLYVYYEGTKPEIEADNVKYIDLLQSIPELVKFKERHKNNLRANGKELDPTDTSKKPRWNDFRWDAVRFSHKSFAICHANLNIDADVVMWVDADSHTHSSVDDAFFNAILPKGKFCGFLSREPQKYTETGFLSFDKRHPFNKEFMERWMELYIKDTIFDLVEWHDCECFDTVRRQMTAEKKIDPYNLVDTLKPGLILAHPFVNTFIGDYMDHLKGSRKDSGHSRRADIKRYNKHKTHPYWKTVR